LSPKKAGAIGAISKGIAGRKTYSLPLLNRLQNQQNNHVSHTNDFLSIGQDARVPCEAV
jgi:hypothetical protein